MKFSKIRIQKKVKKISTYIYIREISIRKNNYARGQNLNLDKNVFFLPQKKLSILH